MTATKDIQAEVARLAADVAAAEGLDLVQVEVRGEAAGQVLRVYLDQPGGIGLEECERASRALSEALDRADGFFAGSYTLEVSSPGLDRPLVKPDDFERFRGQRAKVRTRLAQEGCRNWLGTIEAGNSREVQLRPESGSGIVSIPWDNVESARLAPLWDAPAARKRKSGSAGRDPATIN